MGETYVELYRGCKIYRYTPPDVAYAQYGSPCLTSKYTKLSAVKKRICQGQGMDWVDGVCVEPEEPVTPPPLEPYLEKEHSGVEIWWVPAITMFRATVAPGYICTGTIVNEVETCIDETLEYLNPPEDPDAGLFAQIVATVKTWVQSNMPGWVVEWGTIVYNTVNNIVENITNVYNDFHEYVTNVYRTYKTYLTEVYQDLRSYVTNVYNDTYQYLTQNITNITENITNVIGVTQEALDTKVANLTSFINGKLAEWDSTGFLANPLGIISGVFAASRLAAEHDVIERFWLGFEEGLVSEEEG